MTLILEPPVRADPSGHHAPRRHRHEVICRHKFVRPATTGLSSRSAIRTGLRSSAIPRRRPDADSRHRYSRSCHSESTGRVLLFTDCVVEPTANRTVRQRTWHEPINVGRRTMDAAGSNTLYSSTEQSTHRAAAGISRSNHQPADMRLAGGMHFRLLAQPENKSASHWSPFCGHHIAASTDGSETDGLSYRAWRRSILRRPDADSRENRTPRHHRDAGAASSGAGPTT